MLIINVQHTHRFFLNITQFCAWNFLSLYSAWHKWFLYALCILFFKSSWFADKVSWILFFKEPHTKKSMVVRSGERGHSWGPWSPIHLPGNFLFKIVLAKREAWAGCPSCWKIISSLLAHLLTAHRVDGEEIVNNNIHPHFPQ